MRGKTIVAILALLLAIPTGSRAEEVYEFDLTLTGPTRVSPGVATPYTGRLSLAGVGVPLITITIVRNGTAAVSVTTGVDGTYSASLVFPTLGAQGLVARAFVGLPTKTESPSLLVTVGYELVAALAGLGTGSVSSNPSGISCIPDCREFYAPGTVVTLTPTAFTGSTFASWSGGCTGPGTCAVTMDADKIVTTSFADILPPLRPTFLSTSPASPGNNNNPTVMGSAEAGSTVRLYNTADCSGEVVGSGTVPATGRFAVQTPVADNSTTTYRATATDPSGNISPCSASTIVYVEDSLAPSVPAITGTSPVSPSNNNNPSVQGTAEPGATVRLHTSSVCGAIVASAIASGAGTFNVPATVASDATTTFYASARDVAGNLSSCSTGVGYVEDSTVPAGPVVTTTTPLSPSNTNAPTVNGTAEPGSTVTLYRTASCSGIAAGSATAAAGTGAFGIAAGVNDNSTNTFAVTAKDAAGNISACSNAATYVEDSAAPTAPSLNSTSPASPANNNNVTINGTAEIGSTVRIYPNNLCSGTLVRQFVVGGSGAFSTTLAVADDTTTTYSATAMDPATNVSGCSASITYVEDSTPPAPPVLMALSPASPANNTNPTIVGTTEAGSDVDIRIASCSGSSAGGVWDTPGSFSIPVTVADNSSTTFHAVAADAAGNLSGCANPITYVEDSIAPTFAGVTTATATSTSAIQLSWPAASDAVTPSGSIVYDVCRSTTFGSCRTSFVVSQTTGPGATSLTVGGLAEGGRYFFVMRARDEAGNVAANMVQKSAKTFGARAISAVATGLSHSCALLSDGTARCWGWNGSGQLGNGGSTASSVPVIVSGLSDAVAITVGGSHTCALLSDGTVRCWGVNGSGQLGNSSTTNSSTPVMVSGLSDAIAIEAGSSHTCAVLSGGTARCWGYNFYGQLGNNSTTDSATMVPVSGLSDAVAITAGGIHTCAVLSNGQARCWGRNALGQLGNASTTNSSTPVAVSVLSGAIAIEAGYEHTCALLSGGGARCWGNNSDGQLGDGSLTNRTAPVAVGGLSNLVAIEAGYFHTCALPSDSTARCWGYNIAGQLGNGSTTGSPTPVPVTGLSGVIALSGGSQHTCALRSDGTARCWGKNLDGQLGNGLTTNSSSAVTVTAPTAVVGGTTIATGIDHTCAVLSDGMPRCWGNNTYGHLGNGSTTNSSTPVAVTGLSGAVTIATGNGFTCALLSDGTVRCWGYNGDGRLGNNSTTNSSTPVAVSGLSGSVAITTGDFHACALLADGSVSCWGYNGYGQLGNASTINSTTPVAVTGLPSAVAIDAGAIHTCALLSDGSVSCWGNNFYGQLGNGSTNGSTTPVAVSGLSGVSRISTGSYTGCAVRTDGTARCWGNNGSGGLGNGSTVNSATPVVVSGLSGAVGISAGSHYGCALRFDGTAYCWGENASGQLGNGSWTNSSTPVVVSGLSGAAGIAAGGSHACAVRSDGSAHCWGNNGSGALGDGSTATTPTPVAAVFP